MTAISSSQHVGLCKTLWQIGRSNRMLHDVTRRSSLQGDMGIGSVKLPGCTSQDTCAAAAEKENLAFFLGLLNTADQRQTFDQKPDSKSQSL